MLGDDKAGVTGVRVKNNQEGGTEDLPASGLFLAIGHTPNTDVPEGPARAERQGLHQVHDADADLHQRGRRLCRRRRGRRLLPPGHHLRRHRLHGRPRRRAVSGGEGAVIAGTRLVSPCQVDAHSGTTADVVGSRLLVCVPLPLP